MEKKIFFVSLNFRAEQPSTESKNSTVCSDQQSTFLHLFSLNPDDIPATFSI